MPEQKENPARAPLPGLMNAKLREPHLDRAVHRVRGDRLVTGEKGQLALLLRLDIEHFDALEPGFALRIIDFAEVEHVPLHASAASAGHLLCNRVVMMLLAVFEARMTFEIHWI